MYLLTQPTNVRILLLNLCDVQLRLLLINICDQIFYQFKIELLNMEDTTGIPFHILRIASLILSPLVGVVVEWQVFHFCFIILETTNKRCQGSGLFS